MFRRIIALLLALSMLLPSTGALAQNTNRIQGNNRIDTANQISQNTFEVSNIVILANGRNYVDALPASTLANRLEAPILLTEKNAIPESTLAEIERLGAGKAYILGGESTIEPAVATALEEKGLTVQRIGGADRYETSELILKELESHMEILSVYLTSSIADAVSSGAYRGKDIPLALVRKDVPSNFLIGYPVNKIVLGGENSVSKKAYDAVGAIERIGGRNRYETAVMIAERNRLEHGVVDAILVNGLEFVDAFTATTYAFRNHMNILMTPGDYLEEYTHSWANQHGTKWTIVGGTNMVSDGSIGQTEPTPQPQPEPEPVPEPEPDPNGIDPTKPMVAITYDDGPRPGYTERILDILKENHAKATFFVLGQSVNNWPELVKRAVVEGNEIGNHSYGHPSLTSLSSAGIIDEITRCNDAIQAAAGVTPVITRPTYGNVNQTVRDSVWMPLIYWSIDTRDWESRNAAAVTAIAMSQVKDGDIILMHDTYESTVQASSVIIPQLVSQGYQLVTVSELFQYKGITPVRGTLYINGR